MAAFRTLLLFSTLTVSLAGCGSGAKLPSPLQTGEVAPYPGNRDGRLLVSASWLAQENGSNPNLVILDASSLTVYRGGHIPGAVHVWWQDLMDPNGAEYGTILKPDANLPDPQALRRELLKALGVRPDSRVVIYDDAHGEVAARVLWMLTFLGYPNAGLLDGGLAAWRGAGGTLQTDTETPGEVDDPPVSPQSDRYLGKSDLLALLNDPAVTIVDVRTKDERADTVDDTVTLGSIPGSIALSWATLVDPVTGRLLDPTALQAIVSDVSISLDGRVVLFARFGLEAAFTWFALTLLGYRDVLIYDGGWVEWAHDPSTPKMGAGPA